jgi:hypothetical protein
MWAALVVLGVTRTASAEPDSVAQALFDEGRRLLEQGDIPAACAKFAESQRVEPAGGTLMNLAACHARQGKTATAWAEFKDALTQARRDGRDDRIGEAKRQIAQLEPRLARLAVSVGSTPPAGLAVRLDGTVLGPASWGTAIPVDPGRHAVDATAPGRVGWSASAAVAPETTVRVDVPVLAPSAAPAAPPVPEGATARPSAVPLASYVLAGAGMVGIGVGAYFGVVAANKKHDSGLQCMAAGCTSAGASLLHQADSAAWASDIGFGVGLAAIAAAAYLFLSAPSAAPHASALRVGPRLTTRWTGLGVDGAW